MRNLHKRNWHEHHNPKPLKLKRSLLWMVLLAGAILLLSTQATETYSAAPVTSFTIRADWFDKGNVKTSPLGGAYAADYPCIYNGGIVPNRTQYKLDFPVTAEYTIAGLYAAHNSRPVDIFLDGKKIHHGFASTTGSWNTSTAKWEPQCKVRITKGLHTIKLQGPCFCHICGLRFESSLAFPPDWQLARAVAKTRRTSLDKESENDSSYHLIPGIPALVENRRPLEYEVLKASEVIHALSSDNDELATLKMQKRSTPWVALLKDRSPNAKQPSSPLTLDLSPPRLSKTLQSIAEMIADFRMQDGVSEDFLQGQIARAKEIAQQWEKAEKLPDNKTKWTTFCRLYIDAARLEYDVALQNPLMNFDELLLVRRGEKTPALGLPSNWQSNCALPRRGFDDEIDVLSPVALGGKLSRLYRPKNSHFVGDIDLDYDAGKLLFSSIGTHNRWHVFEINTDGSGLRQLTPGQHADVDNYDACYLPSGDIIYGSTAPMAAVPCVNGSSTIANLYRMNADGRGIRQLCFDQEHNWCPTILPNGRVMYLRWEYTDTPHSHDRVLFHMNPDGTGQMEYYGSNSYWPNSNFYARPIPDHPNKFVSIVSGHHGVPRMGELVVFDVTKGRRESNGAVQRIPGRGKTVESIIADNLVDNSWPKFLHPYPLSEKYFLVASKPTPTSAWGIYLVDVFDRMALLREEKGYALLEPLPLRKTPRPPLVPDKIDPTRDDAIVYLSDIHAGGGLQGIPRGTVKNLRIIGYHFLYPGMGGPQGVVGMEGPWDVKRIVGTVPVEADGSAVFRIPANTPIAVQPLDAEGKALQLMRSWFTAMPGEVLSCVGCHESQNTGPPARFTTAAYRRQPAKIAPWHGPARGFSFRREVQPVLDKYCIGCHNGQSHQDDSSQKNTRTAFDLRGLKNITDYSSTFHDGGRDAGHFSTSYAELHRYVRRPGLESDYHMLVPMEFHADTTQLVQMLKKGHHGVELDAEAWDRLITWIDLNAPFHGTWTEIAGEKRVKHIARRRRELLKQYAGMDFDPEKIFNPVNGKPEPVAPGKVPAVKLDESIKNCSTWPFDAKEARRRQAAAGEITRTIELGGGQKLEMVLIPAGEFVMGDSHGQLDERAASLVKIEKSFWMARLEVTNAQYSLFDPTHDSRVESKHAMQFGVRGFYVNKPQQPVVRVSWHSAMDFCRWLSDKTGKPFLLPSEAQWEYACRAGTATDFNFGPSDADFSRHANLADITLREFVCQPYKKEREPHKNATKYDDWIPRNNTFNDGGFVSEAGGRYAPNAWGLFDMHGNVSEWTRSAYTEYPYQKDDGRNNLLSLANRVARGGSWRDRPKRARSAFRIEYRPYQRVYNVGFRVVCPAK